MQVIFPVINNSDKRMVLAKGFHNTNWICVYDSENHKCNWFDADSLKVHSGNLANELKAQGIEAVVTADISFMALALFLDSGFAVYKAASDDIAQNIKMLEEEKLPFFGLHTAIKNTCSSNSCHKCEGMCKN
ncbi:MAG: NifB/NifX family molybdenum-iron cluster-binding protein [Breznakibacter sp.]